MTRSRNSIHRAAVALFVFFGSGCTGDSSTGSQQRGPQSASASRGCDAIPAESGGLEWLPDDLELPRGSRRVGDLKSISKEKSGRLAVPLSLKGFTDFAEIALREQGFTVIGGDQEPDEVDRAIRRGRDVVRFRARDDYCNRNWSAVEVRYFKTGPSCPGTDQPCDYVFEGFLPPINNSEPNMVEAGKELSITWRLKEPSGQPYSDLSAMVAGQLQEPAQGAAISLSYADGLSFQEGAYRLSIFTLPEWRGSTKIFTLILDDGTAHQARFKFI